MTRLHRQFCTTGILAAVIGGLLLVLPKRDLLTSPTAGQAVATSIHKTPVPSGSSPSLTSDDLSSSAKTASSSPAPEPKDPPWKAAWRRLLAQSATPERDVALAKAWEQLDATVPDAAAAQLLALHPNDRVAVVAILLADAAGRSADEAVHEAIRFCDEDPAYSLEYGRSLISTLAKNGEYHAALDFVLAEESNGWLGENGHKWLTTLFTTWGAAAPEQAAAAAQQAVGPNLCGEALQTLAAVWVNTDPAAAANFAWQLPASNERDLMLDVTLHHWADANPAAAAVWLNGKNRTAP